MPHATALLALPFSLLAAIALSQSPVAFPAKVFGGLSGEVSDKVFGARSHGGAAPVSACSEFSSKFSRIVSVRIVLPPAGLALTPSSPSFVVRDVVGGAYTVAVVLGVLLVQIGGLGF